MKLLGSEVSAVNYNGVLIDRCKHLLMREWMIEIKDIYIKAADWLAN